MPGVSRPEKISDLHYGRDGIDRLYARVWGDSIHFGIYETETSDLEAAVVETKRRMAEIAGVGPGLNVIEVASGWGATARYLARAHAARVTVTNIEMDHMATAETLAAMGSLAPLISVMCADFHRLPFPDGTFDVFWCQEASVHATDKAAVFAQAYRALRPGGRLVLTDQTTDAARCSAEDHNRLAARHGNGDLWSGGDFTCAIAGAGFIGVRERDWSPHMGRHFANLVRRIERTYESLVADIDEPIVRFNLELWRFGRDATADGRIGWSCFSALKP